ncbi:MAG: hypothetical protein P1U63_09460 [Coxiellaceae bacterium]|nr:hypothetical protein [Coxiellaceae bacterium]
MRLLDNDVKRLVLEACDNAIESYKDSCWNFFGYTVFPASNLDRVYAFRKKLTDSKQLFTDCIQRIKYEATEWDSSRIQTFNTFFLRQLQRLVPSFHKDILAQSYKIKFYSKSDGHDAAVLYRADKRPMSKIFREGFKLRVPLREDGAGYLLDSYCHPVTHEYGVSTTTKMEMAAGYGKKIFTVKFNGVEISDPTCLAVNISETAMLRGHTKTRSDLAEVNFLTDIPPQCIYSCTEVRKAKVTMNPYFTGSLHRPMPPVAEPVPAPRLPGAAGSAVSLFPLPATRAAQTAVLRARLHIPSASMQPGPAKRVRR